MIALALLAAQATAVGAPSADTAAIMAPIEATLAAMQAKDGAALLAQTVPTGGTTSVVDGVATRTSWADMAASLKPGGPNFTVRMATPAVEVDGDVAMVWARYTFQLDGKPPRCGVDHFDLVRDQGHWRILNLTFSSRATGCGA